MKLKNACSGAWIAVLAAAADRVSKVLAAQMEPGQVIPLIPGFLRLHRTANTGMAFSILSGQTLLLALISAALTASLTAWLVARPRSQSPLLRASLWMVIGGGLGNLYDRVFYSAVVDFIEPTFIRFAVFNLADVFICVGAGLAALAMLLEEHRKESRP